MIHSQTIRTRDGLSLAATVYSPQNHPRAGILINSATAVKQSYYEPFSRFLSEHGYLVITYDYRGIGKSSIPNTRDKRLTMQAWGEHDLATLIDWATQKHPKLDWHCIGHSVGGQLIGLAANNTRLKSVYCVAAQSGYWNHWESLGKLRMLMMWYALVPSLSILLGKVPGILLGGESLPEGVARQWAFWGRHKHYIVDKNRHPIRKGFARMTCDIKFLQVSDDQDFAPPNSVRALVALYDNANTTVEPIDANLYTTKGIGHFGFFRECFRDNLWQDVIKWIQ